MWSLIDHHLHVRSPLHDWHATAKLFGLGTLVLTAAFLADVRCAAAGLLVGVAALLLTALPVAVILRRMRAVLGFILVFTLLLALTADGGPTLRLGPLAVSGRALTLAALIGCKVTAIALLAAALVASTPFAELCHSLRRVGCPARLVQIILLTYRMNFALAGETESVRYALAARNFRWRATRRGLSTVGTVVGSVLVRSLDRADRLYNAMLARGYEGQIRRLPTRGGNWSDVAKTLVCVAIAATLIAAERLL
ncbi:MAG: cobalt ECF transporter T component CbiQ [Phycisphaerales bacterium]|nr:MAG: cobalt ECF transporter T component CbiQ [Phycisphaerales bacterium]